MNKLLIIFIFIFGISKSFSQISNTEIVAKEIELNFTLNGKVQNIKKIDFFILSKQDTLTYKTKKNKIYFNTNNEFIKLIIKFDEITFETDSLKIKKNKLFVNFGIINNLSKIKKDNKFENLYIIDNKPKLFDELKHLRKNEKFVFLTWNEETIKKDGLTSIKQKRNTLIIEK